ncbi:MAG: MATE family efflux transporter [Candidatus Ratteibacteria bacterium]
MSRFHIILPGRNFFKEIIVLAFPLVISSSAWTIQHFVNRMFLAWCSTESVAASMPAGMTNMLFISIFTGTAIFTETFVAQYYGAKQFNKIGAVVWHGIYIGMIGAVFHLFLMTVAPSFFHMIGHEKNVAQLEAKYFQILCLGAFPVISSCAISGFFAARGKTKPLMFATIFQTSINLILDYLLIFGKGGFPVLGIKGAGIASVISAYCNFLFLITLAVRKRYEKEYKLLSSWKFNKNLFRRILKYGMPSGLQGTIDIAGFAIFLLLLGRIGTIPLAATNIAFNINTLAFMPTIGIGIAVSILVGQNLGANDPEKARQYTWAGFWITFSYMLILAICYVTIPDVFIRPFSYKSNSVEFLKIRNITVILLRFVAFYSLFDAMNVIFSSALRGAGDTRFIMSAILFISVFILIIPSWVFIVLLDSGIFIAWTIATTYVISLAVLFLLRFLHGKWERMRVIEKSDIAQT